MMKLDARDQRLSGSWCFLRDGGDEMFCVSVGGKSVKSFKKKKR